MGRAGSRSNWLTLAGVVAALAVFRWGPSWLSAIVVVLCAARICQLGWRAFRARRAVRAGGGRRDRLG
jgi:hypothetical protein